MNLKTLVPISALAAAALLVAGCGGSTRTVTTTVTAPGGASATATATSTTAAPTTAAATPGVPKKVLSMVMTDFKFTPDTVTVAAGDVKITQKNAGGVKHEFVLLKTDAAADSFPVKGAEINEDTAGTNVGEIPDVPPGKTMTKVFKNLKPGKYVFVCNLPGHYAGGMYGSMTVQ